MLRRRKKPMTWWEPLCFNRRHTWRGLYKLRWVFLRSIVYTIIASGIAHFVVWHFCLPFGMRSWAIYPYALSLLAMIGLAGCIGMIFPRSVKVHHCYLIIQDGQSASRIDFKKIRRLRIYATPTRPQLACLAISAESKRRGSRIITLGIPSKIDVFKLDRKLRARLRLWKRKAHTI